MEGHLAAMWVRGTASAGEIVERWVIAGAIGTIVFEVSGRRPAETHDERVP